MKSWLLKTKGTIDLERFRIPFRVYGEGEDIVCINGARQSMAMWTSFIRNFSDRYRITLFDFPYQGKAKIKNNSEPVSIEEEVDILHSVIKKLNINNSTPYICHTVINLKNIGQICVNPKKKLTKIE